MEHATQKYKEYLKKTSVYSERVRAHIARCAQCEIDFLEIVFQLSEEQVKKLRSDWIK